MDIERYTFEDADGQESMFSTLSAKEAQEYAEQNGFKCIAHTYEWTDSEVAWDYTKEN